MSDQMALEGILSGEDRPPPEPVEHEPEVMAEPTEPAVERPRGPDGKFLSKEQIAQADGKEPAKAEPEKIAEKPKPATPPEQEMTPKERAAFAAVADERRKRQALEAQLAQFQQQQQKPPEPPKAFWDDPEGALQRQQREVEAMVVNTKLNTAEAISRSRHPDFEEKVGVFAQVLQGTPGLHQQWLNAPDPAEFAYNIGDRYIKLQQVGSVDGLIAQARAEERAKMEAEYKAKAEADAKQRAAIPHSLSEVRGVGAPSVAWGGPTSLDNILTK